MVDATWYHRELDQQTKELRQRYFRVKNHARYKRIGPHLPPREESFSLGLLRLATIFLHNGIDVLYCNMYDDIIRIVSLNRPAMVAFSAICPTTPFCADLARKIRLIDPNIRVVIGGAQINVAKDLTMARYGEFDDYISAFDREAAALILKRNPGDLELPSHYADYGILPLPVSHYAINLFSTLGCRNHCYFCQEHYTPFTSRDPIDDLLRLVSLLPSGTFVHFFDSSLGGDPDDLVDLCNRLETLDGYFRFTCDMNAEHVTPRTMEALCRAGFAEVRIGVQSASDRLNRYNNIRYDMEHKLDKLQLLRRETNLYVSIYMLSGLPGSTMQSTIMSLDFIKDMYARDLVDEVKNCIFVPYPIDGIDYARRGVCIENGDWTDYDRQSYPVHSLTELSRADIWRDYLAMTEQIITCWMASNNLDEASLHSLEEYTEYNLNHYNIRK